MENVTITSQYLLIVPKQFFCDRWEGGCRMDKKMQTNGLAPVHLSQIKKFSFRYNLVSKKIELSIAFNKSYLVKMLSLTSKTYSATSFKWSLL